MTYASPDLIEQAKRTRTEAEARLERLTGAKGAAYLNVDRTTGLDGKPRAYTDAIFIGPWALEEARRAAFEETSPRFEYVNTIELRPDGTWRLIDFSETRP